jgi:hypothetical protein
MQQYLDQKHSITISIDSQPQHIINLETGTPAIGTTFKPHQQQPTALKTALVIGGICGVAGLGIGTILGASQQNYQLDRVKSDLVQLQGDMSTTKRETAAYCKRILGH